MSSGWVKLKKFNCLGEMSLDIFDRLGKVSVGWMKLKIFSRLGKMPLSWVKLKFFYKLGKMFGGFGESSYYHL